MEIPAHGAGVSILFVLKKEPASPWLASFS
jgi:hypothetical protein